MSLQNGLTHVLGDDAWRAIASRLDLSPREIEITAGIVADLKESAIAQQIGISTHTVHTHLERLYHKLAVCSRVELVVRIYQTYLGLVNEPGSQLAPLCPQWSSGRCPLLSRRTNN